MQNDIDRLFYAYLSAMEVDTRRATISEEDRKQLRVMCANFLTDARDLIEDEPNQDIRSAGCDLYLTQAGHGAGFWDGDWPEHGDRLTELAENYGPVEAYGNEETDPAWVSIPAIA